MRLIKFTAPMSPARHARPTWLGESARMAAWIGLIQTAYMGAVFTLLWWLFALCKPWTAVLFVALKLGAKFAAFSFPWFLWGSRPVQYKLPVQGPEDAAAVVAALDAELQRLRFGLRAAQADFRHYGSARRWASRLAVVDVLLFADEVVVLGPAGTVGYLLKKAGLRARATRRPAA
jgi:hypothetical protein